MPGKSDLSEGVNGCVDKGGLVNIRTLIFSEHFQQGPFKKKSLLFVVQDELVTC